jgi:hypothetical protein
MKFEAKTAFSSNEFFQRNFIFHNNKKLLHTGKYKIPASLLDSFLPEVNTP